LKLNNRYFGRKARKKRANHPPMNNSTNNADINSILLYSPKKNIAKIIEEYSVLYPATSSASASVKSKGVRFVSASIEMKKIIAQGNKGLKNQIVFAWEITISVKFNEPDNRIIGNMMRPIETSYEIIWAADLSDPKKAYFELLDHPAIMIPYTFRDEIAKIKRIV
jgi:hypothetical protein